MPFDFARLAAMLLLSKVWQIRLVMRWKGVQGMVIDLSVSEGLADISRKDTSPVSSASKITVEKAMQI